MHQSIILKIQAEAEDRNVPLASILSRARIEARKLSLSGVPHWLDRETDGYAAVEDLPDYRWVPGRHEFLNPVHGWRPLIHEGGPPPVPMMQSVYNLEELLLMSKAGFLTMPAGPVSLAEFGGRMTFHTRLRIQNIDAWRSLSQVLRLILDWTIALESAGILGDGALFTASERTEAYSVTQNFIAQNQSIGVAGSVSVSHPSICSLEKGRSCSWPPQASS